MNIKEKRIIKRDNNRRYERRREEETAAAMAGVETLSLWTALSPLPGAHIRKLHRQPISCCIRAQYDAFRFASPSYQQPGIISTRVAASVPDSLSTTSNWSADCLEDGLLEVKEIRERCSTWQWRGQHSINYLAYGKPGVSGTPLLLVHGFGASIPHWRRNIATLAKDSTVYAIDLLGFGLSDKPAGFSYTMETWAELLLDFLDEIVKTPTVLVGNSVGSLACIIAASDSSRAALVKGLVLLNCAGGMNNKAIVDDWRIKLLLPLLWLIDFLLNQRFIASAIFNRVKKRENLRSILLSVYANEEAVDDTLVEIIKAPADDEGALDAFVSIVTGPPGPSPVQLMPRISLPVLILWGDSDPFTPLDGPVGKYFVTLPSQLPNISFHVLQGVGHCPHDDRPDLVHEKLVPWLSQLSTL